MVFKKGLGVTEDEQFPSIYYYIIYYTYLIGLSVFVQYVFCDDGVPILYVRPVPQENKRLRANAVVVKGLPVWWREGWGSVETITPPRKSQSEIILNKRQLRGWKKPLRAFANTRCGPDKIFSEHKNPDRRRRGFEKLSAI